jgi:WD40 repeat-containing protein SMU1
LALGGIDGLIEIWNIHEMQLDKNLSYQASDLFMIHKQSILSLIFSNDNQLLAAGDSEGIIKIWKFSNGKCLRKIENEGGEGSGITCLLLSNNNSQLLAGSLKNTIKIFGLKSGNMLKELRGHNSFIQYITYMNANEHQVFSCSEDSQMIIWNTAENDAKL